jgi:hypothetical protein
VLLALNAVAVAALASVYLIAALEHASSMYFSVTIILSFNLLQESFKDWIEG